MPAPDPLALFLDPLERLAFPYCVTGSVAYSVYGEPRLTADIDVVLLLDTGGIEALRAAFPESAYYVPGSDKHARDIRFILAATPIDHRFVEAEAARLGVEAQWDRCRRS